MERRARGPMAVALAGMLVWFALSAIEAPAAAKLGLLSHYELCEGGDWMSLDDIAVNSETGDVWLESGILTRRLVHATTTGAVIGSNDGTGVPAGPRAGFGQDFEVAFTPSGVYVVDDNGDYPAASGRILKFTAGRSPSFQSHFVRPPGTMPANQTLMATPQDALGTHQGDDSYIFAIDNYELVIYDDKGTFVDSLNPGAVSERVKPPHEWGSGLGAGGMAASGVALYVSDPSNHKVKLYALGAPNPPFSNRFSLKHGLDYDITVGRMAGNNNGALYGLGSTGLVHISSFAVGGSGLGGSILQVLPIEGAKGLTVSNDGTVWVTRNDGILRIGPGGGPVPPPQNVDVTARCGAPRISRSFPTTQQIDQTGYLALDAGCSEPCTLGMTASLETNVQAAAKFPIRSTTHTLARAGKARFKLRFSRAGLRALQSAHRRGKKSRVLVTLTARDKGRALRRNRLSLILS